MRFDGLTPIKRSTGDPLNDQIRSGKRFFFQVRRETDTFLYRRYCAIRQETHNYRAGRHASGFFFLTNASAVYF